METDDPWAGLELLPLVDREGRKVGLAPRQECHQDPEKLHPVVHCTVLGRGGKWLLQKRSMSKDTHPGKWDTSVGGHIQLDETPDEALEREVAEEIGLKIHAVDCDYLYSYVMNNDVESELVYSYRMNHEGPFFRQTAEIDELRFWSVDEIRDNLGSGVFTPNFETEFQRSFSK